MSIERSGPFSRVVATAGYLPSRVVSNDELAKQLAQSGIATSDEWIPWFKLKEAEGLTTTS